MRLFPKNFDRIVKPLLLFGVIYVENGAEKVIKDAEVIRVLEILEEATEVAKSHGN